MIDSKVLMPRLTTLVLLAACTGVAQQSTEVGAYLPDTATYIGRTQIVATSEELPTLSISAYMMWTLQRHVLQTSAAELCVKPSGL